MRSMRQADSVLIRVGDGEPVDDDPAAAVEDAVTDEVEVLLVQIERLRNVLDAFVHLSEEAVVLGSAHAPHIIEIVCSHCPSSAVLNADDRERPRWALQGRPSAQPG